MRPTPGVGRLALERPRPLASPNPLYFPSLTLRPNRTLAIKGKRRLLDPHSDAFEVSFQIVAGEAADGGQGFAAEAKGVDVAEILDLVQFAGGVAGQGQGQIVGVDAAAVIVLQ